MSHQREDRLSEKERTYDIIIPVYGALPYLRQCINSVLENTKHPYNLVIVDDGNGPIMKEYLRTIKSARIITNKKNSRWLKSCNIGIRNTENDIVLLNSDTLVTEGWLEKMDKCAYSDSRIGMVNPFSNNALFLSIPHSFVFNAIPAGFTLESFAGLVSELSECRYPSIPTGLGFCLLIKREVFDCIGVFDEKFELDYGEGSDFCMRAKRKGYGAVCCDDAFIYHYGGKSLADSPDREVHRTRAAKNKNNPLSYLRTKLLTKISEISPEYRDKVSIIMPVYNSEKYLEEAINSVLGQSYSNFELIIVDDGSTDNSLNITGEFAKKDNRVTLIALKENQGYAVARNEGLKRAKGEFITCMDSDDIMLPNAIKTRVEFLNSHPEVDLVFGKIHKVIDRKGNPIENAFFEEIQQFYGRKKDNKFYERVKKLELWGLGVSVTSILRRNLLFQTGYYEESLLVGADKDFFFRIFRRSNPAYVPEPIIIYRLHESNISGMLDKETGEWVGKPEVISEMHYIGQFLRHYRREIEEPKKVCRGIKLLNVNGGEKPMKKIEKVNFNEGSIGKSSSGNNRTLEGSCQAGLLLGQIGHMAEVIDRLRLQIKEQQIAIVAKDQHINNLNKAIAAKDQHINNLNKAIVAKDQHIANLDGFIRDLTVEIVKIKKYSVFYNLLLRFRKELLMWFGKIQK